MLPAGRSLVKNSVKVFWLITSLINFPQSRSVEDETPSVKIGFREKCLTRAKKYCTKPRSRNIPAQDYRVLYLNNHYNSGILRRGHLAIRRVFTGRFRFNPQAKPRLHLADKTCWKSSQNLTGLASTLPNSHIRINLPAPMTHPASEQVTPEAYGERPWTQAFHTVHTLEITYKVGQQEIPSHVLVGRVGCAPKILGTDPLEICFKMTATSSALTGEEVNPQLHRNASRSPPPTLSLYQSNLDTMRLPNCNLNSPSPFLHKGATLPPPMPYDYHSQATELSDKYCRPGSADGISRAWGNTTNPSSPYSNCQSTILLPSPGAAAEPGSGGLASVSTPSIGFDYSTPTSAFSFHSPVFFSSEISSVPQRYVPDHLVPCPPGTPSLERHLLPSGSSHDSPHPWTNHNLSVRALSSAHLSSSSASLTHSDPLPSDSSSRSWTPEQTENSNPPIGQSELGNPSHRFAPLGSPANFEQLSTSFFDHPGRNSPPHPRAQLPESTLRGSVPSQRLGINTSDASSDASLSPNAPQPGPSKPQLMNTSASFGISPAWFEPEIFSPHSEYEGSCNPHLFLPPRHSPLSGDPHTQTSQPLAPKCQSGNGSPILTGQPPMQARFIPGKRHASNKSIPDPSSRIPLDPICKTNDARVPGCNKKKKREVREVEAFCGSEELYVADGFDVIHTCKPCQEGRPGGTPTSVRNDMGAAPFSERTFVKSENRPERNRRTDDVTAPTTCDCCARQLGVGGIVPRNGRSAIQFVVEVIAVEGRITAGKAEFCRVGKWRCKELFSDGRRTCILSHQRQGASTEVITTVWRVRQLSGKPELETLVGQLRELVKHSLYAALATPEILESGLARVSTFDDIKTMYANGWKQIQPLIHEDVENSTGRRRYVGLRWTKPHPRKGPKRGALNSSDQVSPSVREGDLLLEPGKELSGFVFSEWDMHKGTFFVSVAMPWQSGDALESTASLAHKSLVEAKIDRERLVDDLVGRGMDPREANLRHPPIRHLPLMVIDFFCLCLIPAGLPSSAGRFCFFTEKRASCNSLKKDESSCRWRNIYRNIQTREKRCSSRERDCYVPRDEQLGWSVWVRRENGNPPRNTQ
ncbi:hypothetical protein PSHT_16559 [Puccinia striiformis]|uniref:Uncharacterized protein n=1 Tax=Puccinia striiformis TaxID=27350 RepID=A0A2S4U9E6_9BASI|nr:hypothetical protein PSHT_16559 [Puccinia striiformis]